MWCTLIRFREVAYGELFYCMPVLNSARLYHGLKQFLRKCEVYFILIELSSLWNDWYEIMAFFHSSHSAWKERFTWNRLINKLIKTLIGKQGERNVDQLIKQQNPSNKLSDILFFVCPLIHHLAWPRGPICCCPEGTLGGEDQQDPTVVPLRTPPKLEADLCDRKMWGRPSTRATRLPVPETDDGQCEREKFREEGWITGRRD